VATPQYNYVTTDLVSNRVLGELFLASVSLDCQLDVVGNMNATINLDHPGVHNDAVLAATIPGRTAFWAYRGSQIVWGGIIWTREYSSDTKVVTLTGQTFESYAARRYPRSWLGNAIGTYNHRSMAHIINDLWHRMQSVAHGSIGVIQLPTTAIVGDSYVTTTIFGYDLTNTVDAVIQDIVKQTNGPDYTIAWTTDNAGLPQKRLTLGFPIGRNISVSNFIVDYPGSVQNYDFIENASTGNNAWWAIGEVPAVTGKKAPFIPGGPIPAGAAGTVPVIGYARNDKSLNAGWPLLEGVETYSGTNLTQLNGRAKADVNQYSMPLVTHATILAGSDFPPFGTYNMGDYAQINIVDARYPMGYTFQKRIIGWSIQPPDAGTGVETITLVYDDPDPSDAPGTSTTSLIGL
jgi:hypothetical protein